MNVDIAWEESAGAAEARPDPPNEKPQPCQAEARNDHHFADLFHTTIIGVWNPGEKSSRSVQALDPHVAERDLTMVTLQ